jgi:hypothetical protein
VTYAQSLRNTVSNSLMSVPLPIGAAPSIKSTTVISSATTFTIIPAVGAVGAVVVVRLFYQWPQIVTGLGWNSSNLAGSKRLLLGIAAFKNEPY